VKGVTISICGRNIAVIVETYPNIDPESTSPAASWSRGVEYNYISANKATGDLM